MAYFIITPELIKDLENLDLYFQQQASIKNTF